MSYTIAAKITFIPTNQISNIQRGIVDPISAAQTCPLLGVWYITRATRKGIHTAVIYRLSGLTRCDRLMLMKPSGYVIHLRLPFVGTSIFAKSSKKYRLDQELFYLYIQLSGLSSTRNRGALSPFSSFTPLHFGGKEPLAVSHYSLRLILPIFINNNTTPVNF